MILGVVRVERPGHLDDEPPVPVDGRVREVPALAVVCDRRGELVDHVRVGQDARGRLVDRHVRAAHAPRLAEAEADPPLRSDGHGEGRRAVPVPAFVFVDRPEDRRAVASVVGSRGGEEAVAGVAAGRLREPRRVGGLLLGAEGGEVRAPAVAEGEGRQEEGEDELFATDHHYHGAGVRLICVCWPWIYVGQSVCVGVGMSEQKSKPARVHARCREGP
ncbi:hypothetical protein THAOC_31552 [Thalassiosira oceanica]|uniref:Uncharacterized protein n=1 Tax=Thalassiosira oceanica TaxID=159749 RepID=K0R7V9_THAOC|nr:hypothetical protein THAOC_31552 [Thalassiosira oceanica]|eukprot:EJK49563.1 hypothetical protein THAOC_31552 [Thalassiosira oceanica]